MLARFLRILTLLLPCCWALDGPAQPAVIDSLKSIASQQRGDTTEIAVLRQLMDKLMRADLSLTKDYAWRQKSLSAKLNHARGLANAYATLTTIHLNMGKADSAQYYLNQFEILSKSSQDESIVVAYTNSAGLFYRNTGRYKEALPFLLEALRMMGPQADKTRRAGQMLNIGNAYISLGEYDQASKYHRQSLALFEEVGNKYGQAFSLQGLGNTYKELGQYRLAEKHYLSSEKLKQELNDKRGLLSTWMSLGALYQDMKQYDRSLAYTSKGLAAAREVKNTDQETDFLYNMASLMKSMKKLDESRKLYTECLKLANESGDTLFISRIKTDLIMLDSDAKKMENNEKALIENVKIAVENGDRLLTVEGREKLAEWYSQHGRHDKAYEQIKIAYSLSDSIRGAEIQLQIKKMEEEYLGEKKDREIALLKKDQELQSVELSRQNTLTTAGLIALFSVVVIAFLLVNRYRVVNNAKRALEIERVRNNIARDLHDEMGSALSSINILSKVAMVEDAPVARQYIQNIGDQSARIMENMGDIVWSINPRNDNIEKIIARMREFANEILEAREIDYQFTDHLPPNLTIGSEKRKNLFLIFKEAVNNAAKYSRATRMEIALAEENGSLVLTVKDNGQGFEEKSSASGNGLRNMRERAAESGGTLSIRSTPGEGTEIQLRMSIA